MSCSQFEQASQAPQPLLPQASTGGSSRWLPLLGVGFGLMGLIAGVAGCGRPTASSEAAKPVYSDQQVADAKKAVCEAYAKGMRSIRIVAKRQPANDADRLGVAVNSRVGEVAVATYFLTAVDANPSAPIELKDRLRELAQQYQEIVLIQLADGGPSDWDAVVAKIDELVSKIDPLCR